LAGHFQNALYCFVALGLFAAAAIAERPRNWTRAVAAVAGITALAAGLAAIQVLPGLELTRLSIRDKADYSRTHERILHPGALARAALPIGAADTSEESYYLYGGILLIPLAAFGLRSRTARIAGLALAIPAIWYMLGPDFGLYRLGAIFPPLHRVPAPIHLWFVAGLGLGLLAAAGAEQIFERRRSEALLWAVAAVVFADLYYFNSLTNPKAYARNSFDDLYGNKERVAETKLLPTMPPLARYDAPDFLTVFG